MENIFIEGRPLKKNQTAIKNYNRLRSELSKKQIKNSEISSAPEIILSELVIPSVKIAEQIIPQNTQLQQQLSELQAKFDGEITNARQEEKVKAKSELEERLKDYIPKLQAEVEKQKAENEIRIELKQLDEKLQQKE